MRTKKYLIPQTFESYEAELENCPTCGEKLRKNLYPIGRKKVQTLSEILGVCYYPKYCDNELCTDYGQKFKSASWQQLAPLHSTYGYDIIVQIGWERQYGYEDFLTIWQDLSKKVQISESQVRHLYYERYLPLLACFEQSKIEHLAEVSQQKGLLLSLDGLAPEGGEAQLWLVREIRTNLTLRSGWMSEQSQEAFENFLLPLAESGLTISAILSDKQRGLVPAVKNVFKGIPHSYCQSHYLKNLSEPISSEDEKMKITLRKTVRCEIGDLIRQEQVEGKGVLTTTGVFPSSVSSQEGGDERSDSSQESEEEVRHIVVQDVLRRVRYLLTLKGRPPFRLAGIEMYERLRELLTVLKILLSHSDDDRLLKVTHGLTKALESVKKDYTEIKKMSEWLEEISRILDPEKNPHRKGKEVQEQLFSYLSKIKDESESDVRLKKIAKHLHKVSVSYKSGLFHTYDISDLPRTNNGLESEFRELTRRLLRTIGQKGATKRFIQRSGAWELISTPPTLEETTAALSQIDEDNYQKERQRLVEHRSRFSQCVRSMKQAGKKLKELVYRWLSLPSNKPILLMRV